MQFVDYPPNPEGVEEARCKAPDARPYLMMDGVVGVVVVVSCAIDVADGRAVRSI